MEFRDEWVEFPETVGLGFALAKGSSEGLPAALTQPSS